MLSLATAIAQIFPMISLPILSRIYTPEEFGLYALYYAVTTICVSVVTLSMQNSVLIEAKNEDAFTAVASVLYTSLMLSLFLAVVIYVYSNIYLFTGYQEFINSYIFYVPFTVSLAALHSGLYYWLLRNELFKVLAFNKLVLALSTMTIQIIIGVLNIGVLGLIIANILGFTISILLSIRHGNVLSMVKYCDLHHVIRLITRNKDLAIFTTLAGFVNNMSSYLPDLLIGRLYGTHVLGLYSVGNRLISSPLSFVISTIQDLFRKDITEANNAIDGGTSIVFRIYLKRLLLLSIIIIIPTLVVFPILLEIALGSIWRDAGVMIQSMAILVVTRFIASPLSYIWIISGKQKYDLIWQVLLLTITSITFLYPAYNGITIEPQKHLLIYSIFTGSCYIISGFYSFRLSQKQKL